MFVTVEPMQNGRTNMAKDAELLERAEAGESAARVYSWDGAWVSLGRFQHPEKALLQPDKIAWVMRPTGGKAVLHGHDVTVAIALSLRDLGIGESDARRIAVVYRRAIGPLVEALSRAGVSAELAEDTEFVRNSGHKADCFAHVSPNDIVDPSSGKKVCGCALRLTDRAVLVQASIPNGAPLIPPETVFREAHQTASTTKLNLYDFAQELAIAEWNPRVLSRV